MDFVMDALATGRRINARTCVDDFTKNTLTVTIAFGISGRSGLAYSGQHCTVLRLSGDDKN